MSNTGTVKEKPKELSKDEVISHFCAIAKDLDDIITHFNQVQVSLIFNAFDGFDHALEDLLQESWEPLQDMIITFQSKLKNVSNDLKNSLSCELRTRSGTEICTSLVTEEKDNPMIENKLNHSGSVSHELCRNSTDTRTFSPHATSSTAESNNEISLSQIIYNDALTLGKNYKEFSQDLSEDLSEKLALPSNCEQEDVETRQLSAEKSVEEVETIRSHIFSNFISSERNYNDVLYCLKMFSTACISFIISEPSLNLQADCAKLFGKVQQLSSFHSNWLEILESKKKTEEELTCFIQFFTNLKEQLLFYKEHTINYNCSLEILHKFRGIKELCDIIPKAIETQITKISFEDALARPINRISEYYFTINDFTASYPSASSIPEELVSARDEISILLEVIKYNPKDKKSSFRQIIKWGSVVEFFDDNDRKHRIFILMTDYIICASEHSKGTHVVKWYCHLKKLSFSPDTCEGGYKEIHFTPLPKICINELKDEIYKMRQELEALEQKKNSKKAEKLLRTLQEKEAELALKYPAHPLKLFLPGGKHHLLLFASEKVLNAWKNAIQIRIESKLIEDWPIYQSDVQSIVDAVTKHYSQNQRALPNRDSDTSYSGLAQDHAVPTLTGKLFISLKIRRLDLMPPGEIIPHVEIDKHLIKGCQKEKSKNSKIGMAPDEIVTFDLEDSASYLYVTFFHKKSKGEENVGGFVSNLILAGVDKKPFIRLLKEFKGFDMLLFAEYTSTGQKPQYISKYNPFGPSIELIVESECLAIPSVISLCIESVNKRGLDETGIYRLSGVSSKIAELKNDFSEGRIISSKDLEKFDIHVVAGTFKLFLRELRDPVISPCVFNHLCKFRYDVSGPEDLQLILNELPAANKLSFETIMNHLVVVASHQESNKMTPQNLATVFGVSLLRVGGTISTSSADVLQANHNANAGNIGMFEPIKLCMYLLEFWSKNM